MAEANLERALAHTFGHEGGLSLDPKDRGNWTSGKIGVGELKGTKYGVAAHVYPSLDIRNLTLARAAEIYERDYWASVRGNLLPSGIDVVVFDSAVNSGPSRAIMWLQAVVGASADGVFGPRTLEALSQVRDWGAGIRDYSRRRASFLEGLTSWARYGRGWSRRVAAVEAFGISLHLELLGRSPASISAVATAEAADAERSRRRNTSAAATAGTATTADGAALVDQGGGAATTMPTVGPGAVPLPRLRPDPDAILTPDPAWLDWVLGGALLAGLILAAFFVWRSHAQKARRDAYRQLAKGA